MLDLESSYYIRVWVNRIDYVIASLKLVRTPCSSMFKHIFSFSVLVEQATGFIQNIRSVWFYQIRNKNNDLFFLSIADIFLSLILIYWLCNTENKRHLDERKAKQI